MKLWTTILILPILCPPQSSAHFSFFGFGSSPTETPVKASEGAAEAASSNSATVVLPATSTTAAPSPSYTSYMFGTGVTGTQGKPSDASTGTTLGGTQNSQPMGGGNVLGGGQSVQSMGGATGGMGQSSWNSGTSGLRAPILPSSPSGTSPHYYHINNAQTQAKGQANYHPASALPQPHPPRMSLYGSNLSSNLATNSPGLSLFNPRNPQPHLTKQGFPASQSNAIQQDNRFGGNNDGFGNTGKTSTKTGSFSWMSPEGQVYEVNYIADAVGQKQLPSKSTFYAPPQPTSPSGTLGSMTSAASEISYSYTPFKPISHLPDSSAPHSSYQ